jgi:type I restriction enzyme M protein
MSWKQSVQQIVNGSSQHLVTLNIAAGTVKYSSKIKSHRTIEEITGDEEVTRAFLVHRLIEQLDYKPESIEIEKEYQAGRPKKGLAPRIDVILRDENGDAFFFKLERLEASKVQYLVYYTIEEREDGSIHDHAIVIDYTQYENYQSWIDAGSPQIADELSAQYNQPKKTPLIKGSNRDLKRRFNQKEIKALATDLHNVLWGGGGTGDTEIFSSLVNIILAKIQDEYDRNDGEEYQFQMFQYGTHPEPPIKVFDRINGLYRKALKDQLNVIENLEQQFVINQQKFDLSKLVYTVQRFEDYSFVDGKSTLDGKDILGDFFEQIQREGFKQTKGQFFTPMNVVRFLLYALEVDNLALKRLNEDKQLPYIIDPACGSGMFLIEAMKIVTQETKHRRRKEVESNRIVQQKFTSFFMPDNHEHQWAREFIYAIEHNFDLGTATKVNMILHGDGSTNTFVKDGLLPFRFYEKTTSPNFLQINKPDGLYHDKEANRQFDVIVSNPPFSVNLDNQTKSFLSRSFIFHSRANSENLFIERFYQLLREGGRMGVVLPESVFDTTENKYIRLFLYKYFWIRAIVSLPQLAFEPYTSTKTSLLFAQKKTATEVEAWNRSWNKHSKEFSRLKTRAENYLKVYLNNEARDSFPSIKGDTEDETRENLARFLNCEFAIEETALPLAELLKAHKDQIASAARIDTDTADVFGHVNTSWVFAHVALDFEYSIFMAEAENIGYKRTKRGEKPRPNDLFDLEIAPEKLNTAKVSAAYEAERDELHEQRSALQKELSKPKLKEDKKVTLLTRIKRIEIALNLLKVEAERVQTALEKYYDANGELLTAYKSRLDVELLTVFGLSRMERFRSNYVLIRQTDHRTILDHLRKANVWQ